MADSIREQIFQKIEDALQDVPELGTVTRGKIDPMAIQKYPACFIVPGADSVTEYMGDLVDREMTVNLFLWIRTQTNIHKELERVLPAVQKKMVADNTLGGKTIDVTEIQAGEPFPMVEDQSEAGIVIEYRTLYRVKRTDPYAQS